MYNFEFRFKPESISKECIFIPSGYDTLKTITDSFVGLSDDKLFEEVVTIGATDSGKNDGKEELAAEDIQSFLARLKTKLNDSSLGSGVKTRPSELGGGSNASDLIKNIISKSPSSKIPIDVFSPQIISELKT